jgi:hypothetical protein
MALHEKLDAMRDKDLPTTLHQQRFLLERLALPGPARQDKAWRPKEILSSLPQRQAAIRAGPRSLS